jgi:hypothetical protein
LRNYSGELIDIVMASERNGGKALRSLSLTDPLHGWDNIYKKFEGHVCSPNFLENLRFDWLARFKKEEI